MFVNKFAKSYSDETNFRFSSLGVYSQTAKAERSAKIDSSDTQTDFSDLWDEWSDRMP